MVKPRKADQEVQLATKILLAKAIIKNWEKFTEKEKKDIEKWWKKTYGEFKQ